MYAGCFASLSNVDKLLMLSVTCVFPHLSSGNHMRVFTDYWINNLLHVKREQLFLEITEFDLPCAAPVSSMFFIYFYVFAWAMFHCVAWLGFVSKQCVHNFHHLPLVTSAEESEHRKINTASDSRSSCAVM